MTIENAHPEAATDSGRIVVVTGAGSGIGRAISIAFADAGDHVVIIDRDGASAEGTARLITESGGEATARTADVSSREEIEAAAAEVLEKHGRVDVLVNNAAARDGRLDAIELPPETWDRVMAVNVTGPFLLSHAVLPSMVARGSGVILNVSSICGLTGGRSGAAYTASKHALIGLTKNVAFAFAETGVRCNAICPGAIDTQPNTNVGIVGDEEGPTENPRFRLATTLRPGGRRPPSEMGGLALFLASEAAGFVNGQAIVADGGWLAG